MTIILNLIFTTTIIVPIYCSVSKSIINIRSDLNFTELVKYDGYTSETHTVVTKDGYILTLFRIPPRSHCKNNSKLVPVIYQHGLYFSADDCIIPGPEKSLCYIFSEKCYDMWILNSRGNRYSRKHTTLNPDKDAKYWSFTFVEMGLFDTPAFIDYVLEKTNSQQVNFISHSAGVTKMLVLTSKFPEYNKKIKFAFGLSPVAWLYHASIPSIELHSLLGRIKPVDENIGEIFEHGGLIQRLAARVCRDPEMSYRLCSQLAFVLLGYNKYQLAPDVLPVILGHGPAGISYKDFVHWGQIKNEGFKEFDYGALKNLIIYNNTTPPKFDLDNVTTKWIFISSSNDFLGTVKDTKMLINHLSNSELKLCIVPDKLFGHLDYIYGKSAPQLVFSKIIAFLENGTPIC